MDRQPHVLAPVGALRHHGWRAGRLRLRRDQRCHDTGLRSGQRRCGQAVAHPRVTAKNADGSKTVASNATKAIREASQPTNSTPPTITGAAKVGSTLTAHRGAWSGDNLKYSYAWRRCDQDGGSCSTITGATDTTYLLKTTDKGNTIRVRVRPRTPTAATPPPPRRPRSSETPRHRRPSTVALREQEPSRSARSALQLGCRSTRSGSRPRLFAGTRRASRSGSTSPLAAAGPVGGALVYATAVPYNQFSIPNEQPTGSDGWATLRMSRLSGYPATDKRQLLVVFATRPQDR